MIKGVITALSVLTYSTPFCHKMIMLFSPHVTSFLIVDCVRKWQSKTVGGKQKVDFFRFYSPKMTTENYSTPAQATYTERRLRLAVATQHVNVFCPPAT